MRQQTHGDGRRPEEAGEASDAAGFAFGSQRPPQHSTLTFPAPLRLPAKRKAGEINVAKAEGLKVRPIWLTVSTSERYLLLEDTDTGDVLLPLIYMKTMFEANYSRKLSSLQHRLVTLPKNLTGERSRGFVYWQWAFESPHEVKVLVRKMLGEENTPQGHLRLILLPIVFNAMAQKAKLRQSPFFLELEAAIKASSYWPLLKASPADNEADCRITNPAWNLEDARVPVPVSSGPPDHDRGQQRPGFGCSEEAGSSWRSGSDDAGNGALGEAGLLRPKRENSLNDQSCSAWWQSNAQGAGARGGAGATTLNLMGRPGSSSSLVPASDYKPASTAAAGPKLLFHGPYNIERTMNKYCLSYEAAEADDSRKTNKMAERVVRVSPEREVASRSNPDLVGLKQQGDQIQSDLKQLRGECHQHMALVAMQLQGLKDSLTSLMTQLAGRPSSYQVGLHQGTDGRVTEQLSGSPSMHLAMQQAASQIMGSDAFPARRDHADLARQRGASSKGPSSSTPFQDWMMDAYRGSAASQDGLDRHDDESQRRFDLEARTQQLMPEGPMGAPRPRSKLASTGASEGLPFGPSPFWSSMNPGQPAESPRQSMLSEDGQASSWIPVSQAEASYRLSL